MTAIMSDCEGYRYKLTRDSELSDPRQGPVLFIMLNPSTADAETDDPTIRRCRRFAKDWGCAGLVVGNLYALRSPDPSNLWRSKDPIGLDNDYWLSRLVLEHELIVCAWGANAKINRVNAFKKMISNSSRVMCLGTTNNGAPKHPLYIKATQPLIPWK